MGNHPAEIVLYVIAYAFYIWGAEALKNAVYAH